MPTDITPFLRPAVPKTDSDLEKDLEISKDLVDKMWFLHTSRTYIEILLINL